jgi:hypothetical protein
MTEDLRTELIIAIQNNVGPWVALDGWTMFGSQVFAYVESMDDNQLIDTAIKLNIMTEEEATWLR